MSTTARRKVSALAIVCLAFLAGCAKDECECRGEMSAVAAKIESKPAGARMNVPDVLRLAGAAGIAHGFNLNQYKKPSATYYPDDVQWFVLFAGKEPIPGNHFSVSVDDRTGKTEVHPGL